MILKPEQVIPFLYYVYITAITPGPANLCSLGTAIQYGRKVAMRQWLGLLIGFVIVSTSAVLTGAIFGDHCSPISDTTILSSMGAGCNHIDHVKTQMWYALFVAAITILFGYIPAGFGLPIYIVLPMSFVALFIGIMIFGKKVEEA